MWHKWDILVDSLGSHVWGLKWTQEMSLVFLCTEDAHVQWTDRFLRPWFEDRYARIITNLELQKETGHKLMSHPSFTGTIINWESPWKPSTPQEGGAGLLLRWHYPSDRTNARGEEGEAWSDDDMDFDSSRGWSMGVSINGDTPKCLVYKGTSYLNGWFGGNHQMSQLLGIYFTSPWNIGDEISPF